MVHKTGETSVPVPEVKPKTDVLSNMTLETDNAVAGLTVSIAVLLIPPAVAIIVELVAADTEAVLTVKVTLV